MSRGWITAAIIFFLLSCCLGGLVMAGLRGPEGLGSRAFPPPHVGAQDAG